MMAGTIKIDRDTTLKTAQKLETVGDLVRDGANRDQTMQSCFRSWEGQAAAAATLTLQMLHKSLTEFEDFDHTLTAFFIRAAEIFTAQDAKAAKEIEADWS